MQDDDPNVIDLNPQAEQMADESMVRGLAAQAVAIWPQESTLIDAYDLPAEITIADIGCGTGEISTRLVEKFPQARITGVDIIESHVALARERYTHFGERVKFRVGDAFALDFEDNSFDFALNRHMLQSIPNPEAVLMELVRILRPGGRLHVLAEDYGMIKFGPARKETDRFYLDGVRQFGIKTGTDLHIGRNCYALLKQLKLHDIRVNYVVVDSLRVAREVIAAILEAWRDGYHAPIAEHTNISLEESLDYFNAMIECARDPNGYVVWQVPILSALKPTL